MVYLQICLASPISHSVTKNRYQESIQVMLRSLLARTHDSIHPGKDAHTLYTKITELLLKVTKQGYLRNLLNDANVLKNHSDSLSELKNSRKQLDKKDNFYVLDYRLIDGLIKRIENFRNDLS